MLVSENIIPEIFVEFMELFTSSFFLNLSSGVYKVS